MDEELKALDEEDLARLHALVEDAIIDSVNAEGKVPEDGEVAVKLEEAINALNEVRWAVHAEVERREA